MTCMRRHGCTREFTSRLHRSITGIPIRGAITDVAILATAGNAAINSIKQYGLLVAQRSSDGLPARFRRTGTN